MRVNTTIKKYLSLLFIPLIMMMFSGCVKCDRPAKEDVVAYVNKEPILSSELKRNIALRARQDPMFKVTPETETEELNSIIDKKILIQSAMKKGLAREARFVNTIKNFWEQTLIRDFVDYKQKEFQEYVFATEAEIINYYNELIAEGATGSIDELRPGIEKMVIEEKEAGMFEDWFKNERAKAKIEIIKK